MAIEGIEEAAETAGYIQPDEDIQINQSNSYNTPESSISDIIKAQIRQTNSVYQATKAARLGRLGRNKPDPNFNLNSALDSMDIPDEDKAFFADVASDEQFQIALQYYHDDRADKEILSNVGIAKNLALSVVSGLADPINWIPVSRAIKFGSTAVKAAIEGAVVGASGYLIKSKADNNFSASDMAADAVASGLTVGVFAGTLNGIKKGSSKVINSVKQALKEANLNTERWFQMSNSGLYEVSVGRFGAFKQKAKRVIWQLLENSPAWQMQKSGNSLLEDLSWRLFRNRVSNLKKDKGIIPISAEERLNLYLQEEMVLSEKINNFRTEFINSGGSVSDFNMQVGLTIVKSPINDKGIITINSPSSNSLVHNAAHEIIKFQHNVLKKAKENGVLLEDFGIGAIETDRFVVNEQFAFNNVLPQKPTKTTALGHISRKYNADAIIENPEILSELLRKEKLLNKDIRPGDPLPENTTEFSSVTGNKIDTSHAIWNDVTSKGSVTKERKVAVEDAVLLKTGILDYDPVTNHISQFRAIVAQSELNRVAKDVGFMSWDDLKNREFIEKSEQIMSRLIRKGTDEQTLKANKDALQYNFNLINNVELAFKGQLANTGLLANNQVLKLIDNSKSLQFAMMAGQMALSCIPDAAQLVLRHNFGRGMKRLFSDIQKGVFNTANEIISIGLDKIHLNTSAEKLREFKFKYSKDQVDEAFGFLDACVMRNRFSDLASISSPSNNHNVSEKVSRFVSKWSGMDLIVQSLKKSAAEGEYSCLIKECLKGAEADRNYLNLMGISEKYQKNIADVFNSMGNKENDIYYIDPHVFSRDLREQLQASMQSIADQTISTAGLGDVPIFLRTSAGSLFFMFKSYPFIIYNNFFRPMLQNDISKSAFAATVAASLSLSAARSLIKNIVNDRETDPTSMNFWKEVFEYSSIDNYIVEHSLLLYDRTFNRKYNEDIVSSVSVPIAMLNRLSNTIAGLINGKPNLRTIRNMVPGLNFWWARPATNPLFESYTKQKRKW